MGDFTILSAGRPADDPVQRLTDVFAAAKGSVLLGVSQGSGILTRAGSTVAEPLVSQEVRLSLTFRDPRTGQVRDIFLRLAEDDAGLTVTGVGRYH